MEERIYLGFANYVEWERFNLDFSRFVDKYLNLEALKRQGVCSHPSMPPAIPLLSMRFMSA